MYTQLAGKVGRLVGAVMMAGAITLGTATASLAAPAEVAGASAPAREECSSTAAVGACVFDQQQWLADGAVGFGGAVVLTQTFIPSIRGRVCKVEIRMRRNTTAGAGAMKLTVTDAAGAVMDSAAILVAPPLGESVQTFSMGCDGGVLAPGQTYRLRLQSAGSPLGTYSWLDKGGNVYTRGMGNAPLRDYAFRTFMCPL